MDSTHENCERACPKHVQIIKQDSDDRLSNLPVDVLYHILSFLDTTEVVWTSLLSRKWRCIWTSVPRLNFNFKGFWNQEQCLQLKFEDCLSKFWKFVKWTLIIREAPPVHGLHVLCDYFDTKQLKLLLRLCAVRDVQELEILAVQGDPFPRAYSASVLAVTHNFDGLVKLKSSTTYANLKSLRLVKVRFLGANVIEKLLNGCGILENLSLEYCCFLMINVLNISSHKLRKLTFVNMDRRYGYSMLQFWGELKVHTPNLVSFCYIGPMLHPFKFSTTSSLNYALIRFQHEIYPRASYSELGTLVSGLGHAKKLSLSAAFVQHFSPAFGKSCCGVTQFYNLRCLKLEFLCDADQMEGLINLLKLSPNLEVLCVKFIECCKTSLWKSRVEDVACLSHHFKEIEITQFYDSKFSLEFIKFFLENGESLEKMKITQKKKKMNLEKLHALQAVQIASKAVSVSLISISAFGERKLLEFEYRKCRVEAWKRYQKWKIESKRKLRYDSLNYADSFGSR